MGKVGDNEIQLPAIPAQFDQLYNTTAQQVGPLASMAFLFIQITAI